MASIKSNARKVICIGRNYLDHIKELNNTRPTHPFFFLKPPSSILPPRCGPVWRPRGVELHFEVELAVVVGREIGVGIWDGEEWMDAIESYAIGIDMTARNLQNRARARGLPWTTAKGFDTFLPLSEPIPKSRFPDPHDVELFLAVNGKERQRDSTGLMLFSIPRILRAISQVMVLERGDLVLTGTPKGVGGVGAGDVMRAGVRVGGVEVEEGRVEVEVRDREGGWDWGVEGGEEEG